MHNSLHLHHLAYPGQTRCQGPKGQPSRNTGRTKPKTASPGNGKLYSNCTFVLQRISTDVLCVRFQKLTQKRNQNQTKKQKALVCFLLPPEGTSGRAWTRLQPDLTLCHCVTMLLRHWEGLVDAATPPEAPPPCSWWRRWGRGKGTVHLFPSSQREGWGRGVGGAEVGLPAALLASSGLCLVA